MERLQECCKLQGRHGRLLAGKAAIVLATLPAPCRCPCHFLILIIALAALPTVAALKFQLLILLMRFSQTFHSANGSRTLANLKIFSVLLCPVFIVFGIYIFISYKASMSTRHLCLSSIYSSSQATRPIQKLATICE